MKTINTKNLAPVAIFVYNRLKNTQQVVNALLLNKLSSDTDVIFYSDAAKTPRQKTKVNDVRSYIKNVKGFRTVTVVERPYNFYIEQNVIQGITETVNKYGKVIVLEDDGVTSPYFLTFMNKALNFYANEEKVMQISTFTYIKMPKGFNEVFFWRFSSTTGGGWATWKDRWDKFVYFEDENEALASLTNEQKNYLQLEGASKNLDLLKMKPIPWDICWHMAMVRNSKLAAQTPEALTINNGLFSGTHFSPINRILGKSPFEVGLAQNPEKIYLSSNIVENQIAVKLLKAKLEKLDKRKRDKLLHYFVRILVFLKITKLLKRLLR